MFGRQCATVHLIAKQHIGINPRDRKIFDVGIDNNAAEFTEVCAVGPNVPSRPAWPTIGQNIEKSNGTPFDSCNLNLV